ncbi:MAG TPA: DUF2272 domain-containing protein [Acetobacteraceae bacterium]
MRTWLVLPLLVLLAGCAARPVSQRAAHPPPTTVAGNAPPFAMVPYEPISRESVVGIALREWRLFGQPVDDDPPGTRPPPLPDQKPERMAGLWQRVGEYWWMGMDPGTMESAWTGKHDAAGLEFPANQDAYYAWSAAFISYVMRIAGAGPRFPYSEAHSDYIDTAKEMALGQTSGWLVTAERLTDYAPQPGDMICMSRTRHPLTYDQLPAQHFPAHCDIVVAIHPDLISVVGGNIDDAVTMKHVPVTADGKLATPDGQVLDTRYPWMVVLRLLVAPPAPQVATPVASAAPP